MTWSILLLQGLAITLWGADLTLWWLYSEQLVNKSPHGETCGQEAHMLGLPRTQLHSCAQWPGWFLQLPKAFQASWVTCHDIAHLKRERSLITVLRGLSAGQWPCLGKIGGIKLTCSQGRQVTNDRNPDEEDDTWGKWSSVHSRPSSDMMRDSAQLHLQLETQV